MRLATETPGPDSRDVEAPPPDRQPTAAAAGGEDEPRRFAVGEEVVLRHPLRYLKSADPMPMLRPPDLVEEGERGRVVEIRALDQLAVRFRRGTFLITTRDLTAAAPPD
jgi:hypothetical protein